MVLKLTGDNNTGPAIIDRATKSTRYRARDVRADIKEMGFEKGIERAVTMIADEQSGVRDSLANMAKMLDHVVDTLTDMVKINGAMAEQMDLMKRNKEQEESSGH